MHRHDPSAEGEWRQHVNAVLGRLETIERRWLEGSPPTPDSLLAMARDLEALHAFLPDRARPRAPDEAHG